MVNKEKIAKFVLRIDKELYSKIVNYAEQERTSINKVIVRIIDLFFKQGV